MSKTTDWIVLEILSDKFIENIVTDTEGWVYKHRGGWWKGKRRNERVNGRVHARSKIMIGFSGETILRVNLEKWENINKKKREKKRFFHYWIRNFCVVVWTLEAEGQVFLDDPGQCLGKEKIFCPTPTKTCSSSSLSMKRNLSIRWMKNLSQTVKFLRGIRKKCFK